MQSVYFLSIGANIIFYKETIIYSDHNNVLFLVYFNLFLIEKKLYHLKIVSSKQFN